MIQSLNDSGPGNIRGAALDEFFGWYARERDLARLCKVVQALPAELNGNVRWTDGAPRLVPFAWYPCGLIHGVADGLTEGMSAQERDRLARETADHVMKSTLTGLYRAMFKAVVSPKMMARFSPRLWKLYYDSGTSHVNIETDGKHVSTIAGWKGHHPFLCDINRYSGEWIYRALGCESVTSKQLECVGRGNDQCTSVTTWT